VIAKTAVGVGAKIPRQVSGGVLPLETTDERLHPLTHVFLFTIPAFHCITEGIISRRAISHCDIYSWCWKYSLSEPRNWKRGEQPPSYL
jgi:hypothetical protein